MEGKKFYFKNTQCFLLSFMKEFTFIKKVIDF